jgi:chromosome segregation ATPase
VDWLAQQVRVAVPGKNTAVIAVSVTAADPDEAALLVNAVIRAYRHEILEGEQTQRRVRLSQLTRLLEDKENEARHMKSHLKEVEERLGGDFASEKYLESWKELASLRRDLRWARGEVKLQHALKADATRQEAQAQVLEEMVTEVDRYAREAERIGRTPIEIEMQRAELRRRDAILNTLAEERDRLQIELNAPSRVTILGNPDSPAEVPEKPD